MTESMYPVLVALYRVWLTVPDQRFGQLLTNIAPSGYDAESIESLSNQEWVRLCDTMADRWLKQDFSPLEQEEITLFKQTLLRERNPHGLALTERFAGRHMRNPNRIVYTLMALHDAWVDQAHVTLGTLAFRVQGTTDELDYQSEDSIWFTRFRKFTPYAPIMQIDPQIWGFIGK